MKINSVVARVVVEDDLGNQQSFVADAPTIDMAIEKLGAIERKINTPSKFTMDTDEEMEALTGYKAVSIERNDDLPDFSGASDPVGGVDDLR